MDNIFQYVLPLAAGGLLVLYLKRRRSRKATAAE